MAGGAGRIVFQRALRRLLHRQPVGPVERLANLATDQCPKQRARGGRGELAFPAAKLCPRNGAGYATQKRTYLLLLPGALACGDRQPKCDGHD